MQNRRHNISWINVWILTDYSWIEITVRETEGTIKNRQSGDEPKGQSRIDNLETLATLSTHNTGRRNTQVKSNTTQETMSNMDPTNKRWWTQVPLEGKQVLLLIRHPSCCSYLKSGNSHVGARGKNKYTWKGKDPMSFEIWIIRNVRPDRNDESWPQKCTLY